MVVKSQQLPSLRPTKPQTTTQNNPKALNLYSKSLLQRKKKKKEQVWVSKLCQIEARDSEELLYFQGRRNSQQTILLELPRNPREGTHQNVLNRRSEHPPCCSHTSARAAVWEPKPFALSQSDQSGGQEVSCNQVVRFLGLQPLYGLSGGINVPLQHLCTSARCEPAFNGKPQSQLYTVISEGCQSGCFAASKHHSLPWDPGLLPWMIYGLIKRCLLLLPFCTARLPSHLRHRMRERKGWDLLRSYPDKASG